MKEDLQGYCSSSSSHPQRHECFTSQSQMHAALGAWRAELLPNGELPIRWGAAATSVAVQALETMKLKEISGGKVNILMHVKPMQRELSFAAPRGCARH